MAKIPGGPHSWRATEIAGMISEGRTADAMRELTAVLKAGEADSAVQALAAKWILTVGMPAGGAKALRGGKPELLDMWIEIAEMVRDRQDGGATFDVAVELTARHFGYSERHVEKCVSAHNAARVAE